MKKYLARRKNNDSIHKIIPMALHIRHYLIGDICQGLPKYVDTENIKNLTTKVSGYIDKLKKYNGFFETLKEISGVLTLSYYSSQFENFV